MTLTIGALRAEPGQKTRGSLSADLGSTTAEVPLILVNGSRPGPRVVITGGVHGGDSHAGANRQGIPAILVETGQLGDRGPATVRRLLDALYRILHHLGAIEASEHIKQPTVRP